METVIVDDSVSAERAEKDGSKDGSSKAVVENEDVGQKTGPVRIRSKSRMPIMSARDRLMRIWT